MMLRYDTEADALFVELRDPEGATAGERIDEERIVHYDDADRPVAVELLFASRGVRIDGLPESGRIAEAVRALARLSA